MHTLTRTVTTAGLITITTIIAHAVLDLQTGSGSAWGSLSRMLTITSWMVVGIVWQTLRTRQNHRQLLRKIRAMSSRIDSIDEHVKELSSDRAQAAAVVTSIFSNRQQRM